MTDPSAVDVSLPVPEIEVNAGAATRKGYLRRVFGKPASIVSLTWLALVAFGAIFGQMLSPYGPIEQNLADAFQGPSAGHLLGTDELGRDLVSRLMYGAGETILGSLLAVAIAVAIGVPLGVLAGYYGGWWSAGANWLANLFLTLPTIVVLLAVLTVFGNSVYFAMAAFGVLLSAGFIRLARATTLAVRGELYVDAARTFGVADLRILRRHILPNMIGPILIQASLALGIGLLIQAGLGFLGLGTQPPYPSWGNMVAGASQQIYNDAWLMAPAGAAIILTVLAFNFIGDAARDALPQAAAANLLTVVPKKPAKPATPSTIENPVSRTRRGLTAVCESEQEIISVHDLVITYPTAGGSVDVVKGIDLVINRGETLGLVGESGSGKTMTALALLGLVPAPGFVSRGTVSFHGTDLSGGGERAYRGIRGRRIALISQEPMVSLDPCFKIKTHLREALRGLRGLSRKDADQAAADLLSLVGMPDPQAVLNSYPHQLSGGMAQRVAIAWALAGQPGLLIADEPTTALDVTVEAGILDLLRQLQSELGMTILLVNHDLGVVADICDRVAVMHDGLIVETGSTSDIFDRPADDYTRTLLGHARSLERDLGMTG